MRLIFNLLVAASILFTGCQRDTPVEIEDDGIPPAKPIGLKVWYSYDGEIGIEWNKNLENDISFYKIFRTIGVNSDYTLIDSTSSTFYSDLNLEYDSTYYYKISAVDQFGRESNLSDSVFATPKNLYSPYPPYYLNINGRNWDDSLSVKITFGESFSSDVQFYEVHRSLIDGFEPEEESMIGKTDRLSFTDSGKLELLTTYYYKIIAVDKGGLKSVPSVQVSDLILDKPIPITPANNSEVDYFAEFEIQTCSLPANYKIVIQSNVVYGPEIELNFSSSLTNSSVRVPIKNVTFSPYTDYYWRIYTYTQNNNIPNSFSELYKFTIVPGG